MKKKILLGLLILFKSFDSSSQNVVFDWAKSIGGEGYENGKDIVVDVLGNVYATGFFEGTTDFDPGVGIFELTSEVDGDIFISKLNINGDFVWAKRIGATGTDIGNSITLDASGNVYVTGKFRGTVDFDPGPEISNLISAGGDEIFILKLDTDGNFVWAKRMGGSYSDEGLCLKIDNLGNIYTTGSFQWTADFDPGPDTFNLVTSATYRDIVVSKLDANGDFVWAKQMGGPSSDRGESLAIDTDGNIYTVGSFAGVADFDPSEGVFELTSAGGVDIFVSKLDANGNFVWAKRMGGTNGDNAKSIAIDSSGNIYITGTFFGVADFNPGPGVYNLTTFGGVGTDAFISKLSADGNLMWAKQVGGAYNSDYGNSIALDNLGNVYVTGSFIFTADFNPGTATYNLTSAGYDDIFILKLNTNGSFVWARRMGGPNDDGGNRVIVDPLGNVYTAGEFRNTVDFNPGSGTSNLTSAGSIDFFIQKLRLCVGYGTDTQVACSSYTWIDGNEYSESNYTATHVIVNGSASGCDSIVTLNLTIHQPTSSFLTETACGSYTSNGETYTTSGTFTQVIFNANNCDSIITLNLIIHQNSLSLTEITCDSYTLNDETYTVSGEYIQVIPRENNCDSIIILNLTIPNIATDITISETTLTASQSGATYQWIDCDNNNAPIFEETEQSFTPISDGNYAVEITLNECTEISDCVSFSLVGVEMLASVEWNVYPNPVSDKLFVELKESSEVKIFDVFGKIVQTHYLTNGISAISVSALPEGYYFVQVISGEVTRFIKE